MRNLAVALLILTHATRASAEPPDIRVVAKRIDALLEQTWKAEKITPAPQADHAEFLRRAYLDLAGRIPRISEAHAFLEDRSADKRTRLIDDLLQEPRFAGHFARVWRAELVPETTSDPQAGILRQGFEAWLTERFRSGVGYDRIVRELLSVPLPTQSSSAVAVLRDPAASNPLAFYAAKDAKPENLAAAVTRSFLGVRLECAQCHDHPFAAWTQEQFWNQAAFFASIDRQGGNRIFAPLSETVSRRDIVDPGSKKSRSAIFLDKATPAWRDKTPPRALLAEWMTSPKNPYFAKATANRIWERMFGRGIVSPSDDFRDDNPPSHPELLDYLAETVVAADFDLRFLIRALAATEAYQRTSARTHPSQDETKLPARMAVKALSGEQWFDSLALATGYRDDQDKGGFRRQFLARFALTSPLDEPETSVQQALTLQNGRFVGWATDPEKSPTMIAATKTPGLSLAERIETLYLATLTRKPSADEAARLEAFVRLGGTDREAERLADIFWTLLNSAEFRLNH